MMRDLTVLMDAALGRPAEMLEGLARRGVQVLAGCLFPRLGGRVAHICVKSEDVDTAREVVVEYAGAVADDRPCVVVPAGFPGGAVAVARRVSDSGIVVNVSYFGSQGELVIATSNAEGTVAALGLDADPTQG